MPAALLTATLYNQDGHNISDFSRFRQEPNYLKNERF
jgi:hypothetical protein